MNVHLCICLMSVGGGSVVHGSHPAQEKSSAKCNLQIHTLMISANGMDPWLFKTLEIMIWMVRILSNTPSQHSRSPTQVCTDVTWYTSLKNFN